MVCRMRDGFTTRHGLDTRQSDCRRRAGYGQNLVVRTTRGNRNLREQTGFELESKVEL